MKGLIIGNRFIIERRFTDLLVLLLTDSLLHSARYLLDNISAFITIVGLTFKTPKIRTLFFIDIVCHFLWNFLTNFLSLIILTKIKIVLVGMTILTNNRQAYRSVLGTTFLVKCGNPDQGCPNKKVCEGSDSVLWVQSYT